MLIEEEILTTASNNTSKNRSLAGESYSIRFAKISIETITEPVKSRNIDTDRLEKSINILDLINPVTIDEDSMEVIAGKSRYWAHRKLGKKEIYARLIKFRSDVVPEERVRIKKLIQIDENVVRRKLTLIDECVDLAEEKKLYEEFYPEARQGGAPGKPRGGKIARNEKISSFAEVAARKARTTERTMQYRAEIGEQLRDLKAQIENSPIANRLMQLRKLGRIKDRGNQEKILNMIRSGEARDVDLAVSALNIPEKSELSTSPPPSALVDKFELGEERFRSPSSLESSVGLIIVPPEFSLKPTEAWSDLGKLGQRILKPGGHIAIFLENPLLATLLDVFQQNGFGYVALSGALSGGKPVNDRKFGWRPILIMVKGPSKQNLPPSLPELFPEINSGSKGISLKVASSLIRELSDDSDLVLDPVANSATILEAAKKTGRRGIALRQEDKRSREIPGKTIDAQPADQQPEYVMKDEPKRTRTKKTVVSPQGP